MPQWMLGISGLVIVNILIWVFLWGRRTGNVNHRLKSLEKKVANPGVLPECVEVFTEIKEKLSNLTGKVDVILTLTQENHEKRRRKKRETSS